jgi:uncharacterized protein (UPF0332 family)
VKAERKALIEYRLEQADESLDSAQLLLDHKKYRPSVSRAYYAMFYAVQALLIRRQIVTSKHSGAIALFNREFVKNNIFDREFSQWLQEAFDLRQRADYREMFIVTEVRAKSILENARKFVMEVRSNLSL